MKRFFLAFLLLIILGLFYTFYPNWKNETDDSHFLTVYGNIDIRQVDLGFRVSGRVTEMFFQEGDWVRTGDLIALLDKQPYEDQLEQSAAHLKSVTAALKNAEQLLERRKELLGTGGISEQDFDDAISSKNIQQANVEEAKASFGVSKTNLNDTKLFAPSEGTILTRIREPGTVVKPADPIYTVSLVNPVWVRAYVSEIQLGYVYPGMKAEIYTDTPNQKTYQGHVGFISPVAEFTPKTVETTQLRTDLVYRLRIIADNPDQGLRQGMPVTVKLTKDKDANSISRDY